MRKIQLGRSGIEVTDWCLGTMTFGRQTPEDVAHAQIDRAGEAGLTFLDTAEMYPVNPIRPETVGHTEEIIGNWIAKSGAKRDDWVIATKVSGKNGGFVREGRGYDSSVLRETVEGSLRRLKTDRIDLYQTHWPNRGSYMFRQNWNYDPSGQDWQETMDHMLDVLTAMDALVNEGKVRAFGLSNESCWGTANWLRVAEENGLLRVASIQNEYSLMCRLYDTDLAELGHNEHVTLLSFSPLACGFLTGKYQNGQVPTGSRMAVGSAMGGRNQPRAFEAVAAYLEVAAKHDLDPVHMAMAWQRTRPFPVSAILGATTLDQLEHLLAGYEVELAPEVLKDIDAAHRAHPMPY